MTANNSRGVVQYPRCAGFMTREKNAIGRSTPSTTWPITAPTATSLASVSSVVGMFGRGNARDVASQSAFLRASKACCVHSKREFLRVKRVNGSAIVANPLKNRLQYDAKP